MSVLKALIPVLGGCLVIALVIRLAPMDETARHIRLWNELRTLGAVEADTNPEDAERLFRAALSEAQSFSLGGIMTALSLSDLGKLHLNARRFDDSIFEFKEATALELALQQQPHNAECDSLFLKSDLIRLALKTAIAQEKAQRYHDAAASYMEALRFATQRLTEQPVDLIACDRAAEAVEGVCRLNRQPKTVEAILPLFTSNVVAQVPEVYREDIRKSLIACITNEDTSDRKKLAQLIEQRMNGAKQ